jgi:putative ABC transport system permease protein
LGLLGFLLAVIGVYGVISYSTAQRKREIGIRMALGAQRAEAISTIMRQGFMIVGYGVATGVLMAALMGKLAGSFLVNVSPFDVATYATISILLAAIALLASFVPARKASRVDPAVVLRQE